MDTLACTSFADDSQLSWPGAILIAMGEVTLLLANLESGQRQAADELLPLVYNELRSMAAAHLARESPGHTLQATALVHEAYLRMTGKSPGESPREFAGRRHFFAVAAEAMRRVLVDNARRKKADKRGGDRKRVILNESEMPGGADANELLLLDSALGELTLEDAEAGGIAKLRLFGAMTIDDAATVLEMSRATAFRHWTYARAWLNEWLTDSGNRDS